MTSKRLLITYCILTDLSSTRVVCRELGYNGQGRAFAAARFGQGSGRIIMDEVRCTGFERRLADCPHSGWLVHNCGHHEDAGVSCIPPGKMRRPLFRFFYATSSRLAAF